MNHTAQPQKRKQPDLKMSGRPEQIFFKRGNADGQQVHEEILNLANYQGNSNQNHMRYHLPHVRMATIKKNINNKC